LEVTRLQLGVLGQKGHFEALNALLQAAPKGLTYSDLHYGALQRMNTTNIMRTLVEHGLAKKEGDQYVATDAGKSAAPGAKIIIDIPWEGATPEPAVREKDQARS
jgi:predicted transcriptional regulator